MAFDGTTSILEKCNREKLWASLVAQMVKNPPAMQEARVQSLAVEDPLTERLTHTKEKAILRKACVKVKVTL